MIFQFHVSFASYLDQTQTLNKMMQDRREKNYLLSNAYLGSVEDMTGASQAALDAYCSYLPWMVDDHIEANKEHSSRREIDPQLLMKWIKEPQNLSDEETEILNRYHKESESRLHRMMANNEMKKATGYADQESLAQQRLRSTFKSFIFFCRVQQDTFYKVALVFSGNEAGHMCSMANAFKNKKLKAEHPLSSLISSVDNYESWFLKFREIRNKIKQGTRGSFLGVIPDMGVGIAKVTPEGSFNGSGNGQFRFSDLIYALDMSAQLARQIIIKNQ